MSRDNKVIPKDEEGIIRNAAERIHKVGMDTAAILLLETVTPLVYVGGQLARFFILPFLPILGEDISQRGERFFTIFEKRENVEKLIELLEEKAKEDDSEVDRKRELETKGAQPKRGWRRFLPF